MICSLAAKPTQRQAICSTLMFFTVKLPAAGLEQINEKFQNQAQPASGMKVTDIFWNILRFAKQNMKNYETLAQHPYGFGYTAL